MKEVVISRPWAGRCHTRPPIHITNIIKRRLFVRSSAEPFFQLAAPRRLGSKSQPCYDLGRCLFPTSTKSQTSQIKGLVFSIISDVEFSLSCLCAIPKIRGHVNFTQHGSRHAQPPRKLLEGVSERLLFRTATTEKLLYT